MALIFRCHLSLILSFAAQKGKRPNYTAEPYLLYNFYIKLCEVFMSKILVCGLTNVETTVKVGSFPINYCPIEYNFFG